MVVSKQHTVRIRIIEMGGISTSHKHDTYPLAGRHLRYATSFEINFLWSTAVPLSVLNMSTYLLLTFCLFHRSCRISSKQNLCHPLACGGIARGGVACGRGDVKFRGIVERPSIGIHRRDRLFNYTLLGTRIDGGFVACWRSDSGQTIVVLRVVSQAQQPFVVGSTGHGL